MYSFTIVPILIHHSDFSWSSYFYGVFKIHSMFCNTAGHSTEPMDNIPGLLSVFIRDKKCSSYKPKIKLAQKKVSYYYFGTFAKLYLKILTQIQVSDFHSGFFISLLILLRLLFQPNYHIFIEVLLLQIHSLLNFNLQWFKHFLYIEVKLLQFLQRNEGLKWEK